MNETTQEFVPADGARIAIYLTGADAGDAHPTLLLLGSPMDATGFVTLASHFPDRRVVRIDPRGAGRSDAGDGPLTPLQHAGDLAAVVTALGGGPVDVFASSGGAVNALAWAAAHPDQVGRLVAHEPPVVDELPDAAPLTVAVERLAGTYAAEGFGPAMARFIALVSHEGEIDEQFAAAPAPDPAMFGLPTTDDGTRSDPLMRNIPACNLFVPDHHALRALGERVVLAVGEQSGETFAARAARTQAAALGGAAVVMPGDHSGFLGGEYGQTGEPDAFGAALRRVLGG